MKKRIICLLLTLIMLASLAPVTALTASAATLKTSEKAITVLKQLEGYSKTCYELNGQYLIGYGTVCTKSHTDKDGNPVTHTLTEQGEADTALRNVVADLDTAVNKFASSNGLTLKQNQHDALVLFSYNCGTAWMNGTGVFRSAVINGAAGTEFLNAIGMWNQAGGSEVASLTSRRMAEANMYLNNVYSNKAPSNYTYIIYNANGGTLAQGDNYRQYNDTALAEKLELVPTKSGATFKGWYTAATGGERITVLDANAAKAIQNHTLYAVWQVGDNPTAVSYELSTSRISPLTVYKDYGKTEWKEQASALTNKETVTIVQDYLASDGTLWCQIKDSGWVKVGAAQSGSSASSTDLDVTVTVTNSYVNAREKASIYSKKVGSYNLGTKLRIIGEPVTADGFVWGQVAKSAEDKTPVCWVALMYTNYNTLKDAEQTSAATTNAVAKATVVCANYVNVRSDAGTSNRIVGALANGNQVNIYEIKTVNGIQWGRTTSGWFCLTYANVTMLNSSSTTIDPDMIAYAFTGKLSAGTKIYKEAGTSAEVVSTLKEAKSVTVTGLKVVSGVTWCKISDGWVELDDITMDIARYLVTASSLNVRSQPGTQYERVDTLSKGVELEISKIQVVGTAIWGYNEKYSSGGWVNLDASYVQRTNAPEIKDTSTGTGTVATIVGAEKVNVRAKADIYGKLLGQIARGTTANILDESNGWYKLDYDVDNDPATESWVYKDYVEKTTGTVSSGSSSTGASTSDGTGSGIVANTYSGVNVRTGAGTAYAIVTKLLPGTQVEILEVKTVGASKWGRISQGWVCMDYIAMMSYDDIPGYGSSSNQSGGGTTVDSWDKAQSSATTAIYSGKAENSIEVRKSTDPEAEIVRTLNVGDTITLQELIAVTTTVETPTENNSANGTDTSQVTVTKTTTYWARVNDGYILNPEDNLVLDALNEETYTVTGAETLNIRAAAGDTSGDPVFTMKQGEKATVTALTIIKDKVWGRIETEAGKQGWARLDYMSEGAIYVAGSNNSTSNSTSSNTSSNTSTTTTTGTSTTYKYTGKVINTDSLNVRNSPSTTAKKNTELKRGASLVIYETTISENMAWGRCDAGWVYLYYVDLAPSGGSAIDARVVYNDNTTIYTDSNCSEVAGSYSRMTVIDIYEIVGNMARTDQGWVSMSNLL